MNGTVSTDRLRSLQGSVNLLDANGTVMRASIDQLAELLQDLSTRVANLEQTASAVQRHGGSDYFGLRGGNSAKQGSVEGSANQEA